MKNHVYKLIELTGTSTTSIEDAVAEALKHAVDPAAKPRWFQVTETRGDIENGQVHHWQVTIKVGLTLQE